MEQTLIYQMKAIYYPILAAVGVPVNVVAIVILCQGQCGLSRCITRYLVSMATADFLVVLTDVILHQIPGLYFVGSYLDLTPVCSLKIVFLFVARDTSVWLTVAFTFDRFVAICCLRLKTRYCTERTGSAVIAAIVTFFCLKNIPLYFRHQPRYVIGNLPWFCKKRPSFYTSPGWVTFAWLHAVLTPCIPFVLILLLNALTVRHIVLANRVRCKLRAHNTQERDPEMENRRKSIILLFAISGSFILLWMSYVVYFVYNRIINAHGVTSPQGPLFIFKQMGFMLQRLSSCTNTCIYAVTQVKFRQELKKVACYPLNLIVKVLK